MTKTVWLHREIYNSKHTWKILGALLVAERKNTHRREINAVLKYELKDRKAKVQFKNLCANIDFLRHELPKTRLKAIHNQRNVREDYREARVLNYLASNPGHGRVQTVKKLNYWDRV